ncbi:hypothetical protein F5144DRAFT_356284 [Chaetomium tenue]|uniref:Uncharacterized protein n=1 Tax=Chaetomium tenue TaxID=1854479 RepID=A0ACB7P037_9PEZI|nr:hypothetical protein F5144DRAFT_356284 [Chaetomium globosum]
MEGRRRTQQSSASGSLSERSFDRLTLNPGPKKPTCISGRLNTLLWKSTRGSFSRLKSSAIFLPPLRSPALPLMFSLPVCLHLPVTTFSNCNLAVVFPPHGFPRQYGDLEEFQEPSRHAAHAVVTRMRGYCPCCRSKPQEITYPRIRPCLTPPAWGELWGCWGKPWLTLGSRNRPGR